VEETSDLNWVHDSLIPFIKENKDVAKLTTYMGKRILESWGSSKATSSKISSGREGKSFSWSRGIAVGKGNVLQFLE
jgi:hypothetical protein